MAHVPGTSVPSFFWLFRLLYELQAKAKKTPSPRSMMTNEQKKGLLNITPVIRPSE
jgi:hypothetical protein